MKLVSYKIDKEERAGFFYEGKIFDMKDVASKAGSNLPSNIIEFLNDGPDLFSVGRKIYEEIKNGRAGEHVKNKIQMLAPIPHPTSCRDGYAFRQHVATARRNRNAEMIPEFDQFPVFYFTNHNAVFGEGDFLVEEDHLKKLDFELEAAIVIGKRGKNIEANKADNYIAGYTIMNDFSARQLQMEEMKLNLGPAKGKDFGTTIGPWLVTTDELNEFKIETPDGNKYDLEMTAVHNGKEVSRGNLKDMNWTFAQIIERASYGVELLPGDVIGSGTVGTGCYLELNGTHTLQAKEKGEDYMPVWLKENDTIELEISQLGVLRNKIVLAEKGYSILEKKKKL